jgi:hypothetical protein
LVNNNVLKELKDINDVAILISFFFFYFLSISRETWSDNFHAQFREKEKARSSSDNFHLSKFNMETYLLIKSYIADFILHIFTRNL